MKATQRFIAFALIAAVALPVSLLGESRTRQRTDLEAMAEELAAVLGRDAVEISSARRTTTRSRTTPPVRTTQPRRETSTATLSHSALVSEMNRYRTQAGLEPLQLEERLSDAATDRVRDMFSQRYFNHVAPDGTQPFVWAKRHSYQYRAIGENLAAGYPTARQVVSGWMNSPGHRANILSKNYRDVGLAVSDGFPGRERIDGPTVVALYASEL